jgi:hypothetical protein
MLPALRPYDFSRRQADPLGTMWTMRKGPRVVICTLATHPQGWELAVTLDGERIATQTRVCYTQDDVLTEAAMLEGVWAGKGWA